MKMQLGDSATNNAILSKLLIAISGPLLLIIVSYKLSIEIQGYYFVFLSLQSLSMVFELGLSQVIIVHLSSIYEINTKDNQKHSEISSLINFALKSYLILALFFSVTLLLTGFNFFNHDDAEIWKKAWIFLCIVNFFDFILVFLFAVFEGLREVRHVYFLRLCKSIIYTFSIIFLIIFDFSLISLPIAQLCAVVFCFIYLLYFLYGNYFHFFTEGSRNFFLWAKKILPWQSKVAIVSLSGYCSLTLITPLIFKVIGVEEAARVGLLLSVISIISSISYSFFQTKVSLFAQLVSNKNFKILDEIAIRQSKYLIFSFIVLSSFFLIIIFTLNLQDTEFSNRISNFRISSLFLLGAILGSISQPIGHYLRSYKKEPLFYVSIIHGFSVPILGYFLTLELSSLGFAISYLILNCFFLLPLNIIILILFIKKRKQLYN